MLNYEGEGRGASNLTDVVVAFKSCPPSSMTAFQLISSCGGRLLPALMHRPQGSNASSNAEVQIVQ